MYVCLPSKKPTIFTTASVFAVCCFYFPQNLTMSFQLKFDAVPGLGMAQDIRCVLFSHTGSIFEYPANSQVNSRCRCRLSTTYYLLLSPMACYSQILLDLLVYCAVLLSPSTTSCYNLLILPPTNHYLLPSTTYTQGKTREETTMLTLGEIRGLHYLGVSAIPPASPTNQLASKRPSKPANNHTKHAFFSLPIQHPRTLNHTQKQRETKFGFRSS